MATEFDNQGLIEPPIENGGKQTNPENNAENPEKRTLTEEEVTKLLNTAKASRSERDEANRKYNEAAAKLKQLENINPEEYKRLQNLAKQVEERDMIEQRRFAELKQMYEQQQAAEAKRASDLETRLKETTARYELEKAFHAYGGKNLEDSTGAGGVSYFDMLLPQAMKYISFDEAGKISIIDPITGLKKITEKGTPYTVDDLIQLFRSAGATAALFKPINNASGSGMPPGLNNGKYSTNREIFREQTKNLPAAERLRLARENGL